MTTSILDTLQTPADRPIICTICGDAGTGKTVLAATFPNPVFIRAEDGMQSIARENRPPAFPLLSKVPTAQEGVTMLFNQLLGLLSSEHDFRTLVIDSVSALDQLFTAEVLERDGKARSINQAMGGYGAGPAAVSASHARVRKAAVLLNERKNMNVVFLAHADVETMRLPDADDYQRYSLRLPTKSLPYYVDDVDLVGFIKIVSIVRGDDGERKRVTSTGDRELIVHATAANVSKNRFGITEPLDVPEGENPLYGLVPGLEKEQQKKTETSKKESENV